MGESPLSGKIKSHTIKFNYIKKTKQNQTLYSKCYYKERQIIII